MLGLTFSSKLYWSSYIISNAKTASKKIGALIHSTHYLLCISINLPCMEHYCQVRAGTPSWYLELLDKPQKQICRTVGPSLVPSLEPLAHHQNVASLSLFCRYYLGRCSSELTQLVPLPYSRGRSTQFLWYLIGEKKTGHKINQVKLLVRGNFRHLHIKLLTFPQLNFGF